MTELRTSVVINLLGNLERRARDFSGALSSMGRRGAASLRGLSGAAGAADQALVSMGNRWTALALGAAGVAAFRRVGSFEERLTDLAVRQRILGKDAKAFVKDFGDALHETAEQRVINVDELVDAADAIVDATGDLDLFKQNMDEIATVMAATKTRGAEAGAMFGQLAQKLGIREANEMLKTLSALSDQAGRLGGGFELRDFAGQVNELTAAWTRTGRAGFSGAVEMGALIQVIRQGAGSAAEATTRFERLISSLTSESVEKLRERGIEVWDQDALAQGIQMLRPVPALIKEIITRSAAAANESGKSINEVLMEFFPDIRTQQAMQPFIARFLEAKKAGNMDAAFADLNRMLTAQGDVGELREMARTQAATISAAGEELRNSLKKFVDEDLLPPTRELLDKLRALGIEGDELVKGGLATAGAVGAYSLLRRLGIGKGMPGTGGTGVATQALAGAGGALPVFVTNMPGSLGGDTAEELTRRGNEQINRTRNSGVLVPPQGAASAPGFRGGGVVVGAALIAELLKSRETREAEWEALKRDTAQDARNLGFTIDPETGRATRAAEPSSAKVTVEFLNPPPGMRVRGVQRRGAVDLDLYTGPAMVESQRAARPEE